MTKFRFILERWYTPWYVFTELCIPNPISSNKECHVIIAYVSFLDHVWPLPHMLPIFNSLKPVFISCFFFLVTICPQRISTNNVQLTSFNQHTLGSLNLLNDMENPGFPICYLSLSLSIYIYNDNDNYNICFFAYNL